MTGNDHQSYSAESNESADSHRNEDNGYWENPDQQDTVPSEFRGFWSERKPSRRPGSAGPVMLLARLAGVVALVFAVVAIIALHSTGKQRLADHIAAPMRTHTTSPKPTRHRNRAAKPRREHVVKHRMRSAHSAHGSTQPVVVTVAPGGAGGSTRRSSGPAHSPRTRPRAASKVKVGGDVTCLSGRSVEGVWVQASAHSGYAPWQGVTVPGKKFGSTSKWWWWLPAGASYSLHVGCGGTQANWAVAAYTPTVSGTSNSFDCEDLPSQAGYAKCYRI